jgi:hypothetical protein
VSDNAYTVTVRENHRTVSVDTVEDPFIRTTLHPKGIRAALGVLFGTYSVTVWVSATLQRVEDVLALDSDYVRHEHDSRREAASQ